MLRTASRRGGLAVVVATLLLATGCGSTEPEPVEPLEPVVPADLCATVPAQLREGLIVNANNSDTGNPTAACSMRSATTPRPRSAPWSPGCSSTRSTPPTRSWTASAAPSTPRSSACRTGSLSKGRSAALCGQRHGRREPTRPSMAALTDREVITVRLDYEPKGKQPAMTVGKQMLEGVISTLAGKLLSRS